MDAKRSKFFSWVILIIFSIMSNGCATFTASQLPQRSILSYVNRVEKGDLVVAAENFYTSEKSISYFDTDLTGRLVAPIFFVVSNRSTNKEYVIDADSFGLTASNINATLTPMIEDEIARKVKRGTFWRTLGWCCIVPLIAIPVAAIGSAAHTGSVNKKAADDAKSKNLLGQSVGPNDTVRGIVFFDMSGSKARKLIDPVITAAFISSDGEKIEMKIAL